MMNTKRNKEVQFMGRLKAAKRALAIVLAVILMLGILPASTMAAENANLEIAFFAEIFENIRFQRGYEPALPQSIEGMVNGELVQIPVRWESAEYSSLGMMGGLAVFIATPAAGYIIADGAEAPTIAFFKESFAYMGGQGTAASPLQIVSAAQLAEIAALTNAGKLETTILGHATETVYIKLMEDIDLSGYGVDFNGGKGWIPIGTETAPFKGIFDGNKHVITGLYINDSACETAGLFGHAENASISTIGVEDAFIFCESGGILLGSGADVTLEDCYTSGKIIGNQIVGGLSGAFRGPVERCYSFADVKGNEFAGGLIGVLVGGSVTRCAALNPSVVASVSGHIVGAVSGGYVAEAAAFTGMKGVNVNDAGLTPVTVENLLSQYTLFGMFENNGNPWTCASGKLPGFGKPVDLPFHLRAKVEPFEGEGTAGNPYKISNAQELAKLAELVNDRISPYDGDDVHYELTNNIDLSEYSSGEGWTPIGNTPHNSFNGIFNGANYEIGGAYIRDLQISLNANFVGVFGIVLGRVENLGVCDVEFYGLGGVGAVAGYLAADGVIKNCYSTGYISGSADLSRVGGIVGCAAAGLVENCYSTVTIVGCDLVGGITGYVASSAIIRNCAALNDVVRATNSIGARFGGLVGYYEDTASIQDSIRYAGIDLQQANGVECTAGLPIDIGPLLQNGGALYTMFENAGASWISEPGRLPGLGKTEPLPPHLLPTGGTPFAGDGSLQNPFKIRTPQELKCLADYVNSGETTYNNVNTYYLLEADLDLSIYGVGYNGGKGWTPIGNDSSPFCANFDGGGHVIDNLYINSSQVGENVGLFGEIDGGSVKAIGLRNVDVTGTNWAGGLVASVASLSSDIEACFVTGSVNGSAVAGGLVGHLASNAGVVNCYTDVNVTATVSAAGIVGVTEADSSVINCYAVGTVSASDAVAGIAGNGDGLVSLSAALNKSISVSNADAVTARVALSYNSGNRAFNDMNVVGVNSGTIGADTINGGDMTASDAFNPTFWTDEMGWDATIWELRENRLPILKGLNGQTGTSAMYLTVRDAVGFVITLSETTYAYDGDDKTPELTVTFNGVTLIKDRDYTVSYEDNINAGTATAIATGIGNYTNTASAPFTIEQLELSLADLTYEIPTNHVYNGAAQGIDAVTATGGGAVTIYYNGSTTVPTVAGTYTVTVDVAAVANYAAAAGISLGEYTIAKADPNATFPTVTVKYGTTLADAIFASEAGDGTFAFTNNTTEITFDEDGDDFEMTFTPNDTANYNTLTDNISITVVKGDAPGDITDTLYVATNTDTVYTLDFDSKLPDVSLFEFGTVTYKLSGYSSYAHANIMIDTVLGTIVSTPFSVRIDATANSGLGGKIEITVTSDNYEEFKIVIDVVVTDEATVIITATVSDTTYNGDEYDGISDIVMTLDNTDIILPDVPTATYEGVGGTSYGPSSTPPTDAGDYKVTLDAPGLYSGTVDYTFTIQKKELVVRTDDIYIKRNAALPTPTIIVIGVDDASGIFDVQPIAELNVANSDSLGESSITFSTLAELTAEMKKNHELTHETGYLRIVDAYPFCDVINVVKPSGATISGMNITATVRSWGQQIDVIVSEGATWALYSDPDCTEITKIANSTMSLAMGENTAYIKVTAEDGTTTKIYMVTITRLASDVGGYVPPLNPPEPTPDQPDEDKDSQFIDIEDHWAKDEIEFVVEQGLFNGMSDTIFDPNGSMTRGMFVTVLGRMSGADVSGYETSDFADVADGKYYTPYIGWAHEYGIVLGIGDNRYAPDRPITRQEMALIMTRYAEFAGFELTLSPYSTFADDKIISEWAYDAVVTMQRAGIMLGDTQNKFNPHKNATRAEVATLLTRYLKIGTGS